MLFDRLTRYKKKQEIYRHGSLRPRIGSITLFYGVPRFQEIRHDALNTPKEDTHCATIYHPLAKNYIQLAKNYLQPLHAGR